MSLLLYNSSIRGCSTLSRMVFYRFCYLSRSPIIDKLNDNSSVDEIIEIYQQYKEQFDSEHYATTCKSLGKHFHNGKWPIVSNIDSFSFEFVRNMENSIQSMSPTELLDVLFLFRRQRVCNIHIFQTDAVPFVMDQITRNINIDTYNIRNLITLIYNLSVLEINSTNASNALLAKLINPVGDVTRFVTISSVAELINGFSGIRLMPTLIEKRIITEVLNILDQSETQQKLDCSSASHLLRLITKVSLDDSAIQPFTRKLIVFLEENCDNMNESDIMCMMRSCENTTVATLCRPALLARNSVFESIAQGKYYFGVDFLFRMLNTMSKWSNMNKLTPRNQELIINFVKNDHSPLDGRLFMRYSSMYMKLFSQDNASTLAHLLLSRIENQNLSILANLSRFADITSRLREINIEVENANLIDLLKLELIFRNTKNLPPELALLEQNHMQLIKKAMEGPFYWSAFRNYLKDSDKQGYQRITEVLKEHVEQMSNQELAHLMKKQDFVFTMVSLMSGNPKKLQTKLKEITRTSRIKRRVIQAVITLIDDNATPLVEEFWAMASIINLDARYILFNITPSFFLKSVRNINTNHHFHLWLLQQSKSPNIMDASVINIYNLVLDNSSSSVANMSILDNLLAGIHTVSKIDRSSIFRTVQHLKREGLLNKKILKRLTDKFDFLDEENFIVASQCLDIQKKKNIISKISTITPHSLEILLMFDCELWKHLKGQVMTFIEEGNNISLSKWKFILSSLKPRLRRDEDYRDVTNALIDRFLVHIDNWYLNLNIIKTIEIIGFFLPEKITPSLLERVIQRGTRTNQTSIHENVCHLLNKFGYQDLFGFILKMDNRKFRLHLMRRYNIKVPFEDAHFITDLISTRGWLPQGLLVTLINNDHIPQAQEFIRRNTAIVMSSNLSPTYKSFIKWKYGEGFDVTSLKLKNEPRFVLGDKVKEMAASSGIPFVQNPVVKGVRFNYKIGDKLVMVVPPSNFVYIPNNNNNHLRERPTSVDNILQRIVASCFQGSVIWVPNNLSSIRILLREIPELRASHTKKRGNNVAEETDPDEDIPKDSRIEEEEDISIEEQNHSDDPDELRIP